ncbi:MAG: AAA family ATPase [Methylococcaceae bacterium]
MKFPYGLSDFGSLIEENYFYQDRTHHIPLIEDAGKQLVFLRPRRFGKSLLLSMLEHYYDLKRADQFETLFGALAIGQNPTPLHNQYFIMHWDFSLVKAQGDVKDIEAALHRHIAACIHRCATWYGFNIAINPEDAVYSFHNLLTVIQNTEHKLYLFIDEYDNFANEVLMAKKENYEKLLYGEGLFKTVFKAIKGSAGQGLDRVFITGVSPVAMADMTSGYNVAENTYLNPEFNDLCGFTEAEIIRILQAVHREEDTWSVDAVLAIMRTFYNGYRFSEETDESVYNPTLSLYFLKQLQKRGHYPREMLDDNLAMDRHRLIYVAGLLEGEELLIKALSDEQGLVISRLSRRFGAEDMLKENKDRNTIISLLYYFGILTLAGTAGLNKLVMKIPNLVSRSLYVEQLQDLYLSTSDDQIAVESITDELFLNGNLQPVCDFLEQRLMPVLSTRDYRWSNELAVKVMFMTVLFNDRIYMMVSETEVDHGYIDLSFIVRPDMRRFQALDLILEFKYVGLKELGLTGLEVKAKSREELLVLPLVRKKLDEARSQAERYADTLKTRYGLPTITCFAVVALGLERVVFESV